MILQGGLGTIEVERSFQIPNPTSLGGIGSELGASESHSTLNPSQTLILNNYPSIMSCEPYTQNPKTQDYKTLDAGRD